MLGLELLNKIPEELHTVAPCNHGKKLWRKKPPSPNSLWKLETPLAGGVVRSGGTLGTTVLGSSGPEPSAGSWLLPVAGVVRCSGTRGAMVLSTRGSSSSSGSPVVKEDLEEGVLEEVKKTVVSNRRILQD